MEWKEENRQTYVEKKLWVELKMKKFSTLEVFLRRQISRFITEDWKEDIPGINKKDFQ